MKLDLNIFSALLVPARIAPDKDFFQSAKLNYINSPEAELRAKIRYTMGQEIEFVQKNEEDVSLLTKHWRAELAPEMGEEQEDETDFSEDDLQDLSSDAPVIRLVNLKNERQNRPRPGVAFFNAGPAVKASARKSNEQITHDA